MLSNHLRCSLVLAALGAAVACGDTIYPSVVVSVQVTAASGAITSIGATRQFSALVQDQFGNTLTGKVVVWLSSSPSVATVDIATGLVTAVANGMSTITARVDGITGTGAVTVAQQAAKLAYLAVPSTGTAGRVLSPTVKVEIEDAGGARVTNAGDAVTLTFGANPSGATLVGTTTVNAASGVATFTGLAIDKAGVNYTLVASVTALPNHTSTPFTIAPAHGPFAQISPGLFHTCGVTLAGATYCWGDNSRGELGDGTTISRPFPEPVTGSVTFTAVSSGSDHTCGITAMGAVYCWGANSYGQLGDGSTTARSIPTAVAGGLTFSDVSAGFSYTCAVTTGGTVYCWGHNDEGQLGDGSTADHSSPMPVLGSVTFAAVSASSADHTCGRTAGSDVYCWGDRVGDGTTVTYANPVLVADSLTFAAVNVGEFHTCGIAAAVTYCWGGNSSGQIGDGTAGEGTDRLSPVAVTGGVTFVAVSPGGLHTCAVTAGNVAYCWGYGALGQLGNGSFGLGADRSSPTLVTGGLSFASVSTGYGDTCGLTLAGAAYCWGLNDTGALGDGTTTARSAPVLVGP